MQNKVFENLLTSHGLDGGQNRADLVRSTPADNVSDLRFKQMEQGGSAMSGGGRGSGGGAMGGGGGPNRQPSAVKQRNAAEELRKQSSGPICYELDASPEQFETILKQIGEKIPILGAEDRIRGFGRAGPGLRERVS